MPLPVYLPSERQEGSRAGTVEIICQNNSGCHHPTNGDRLIHPQRLCRECGAGAKRYRMGAITINQP